MVRSPAPSSACWPSIPRAQPVRRTSTISTTCRDDKHRLADSIEDDAMTTLKPQTRDKLKTVSTATLFTALFKRGLRNQYIQGVLPLNPQAAQMVGEAYTLRYIPAREDLNSISVF